MGNHGNHHHPKKVTISAGYGKNLTLEELVSVARYGAEVVLDDDVENCVKDSFNAVERMLKDKHRPVYGITTGFGSFQDKYIGADKIADLQLNLIRSHACGVGKPLSKEVVRAMMLLRLRSLAQGNSGVSFGVIETLVAMLNKKVTPVVPEKGSLGSSGDLCPLSHMVLPMLGEGEAYLRDSDIPVSGEEAMTKAGIKAIELGAKEGLALNNGTQCMTAIGALAVHDAIRLVKIADLSAALTLEALNGKFDALDSELHEKRRHKGQAKSARRILGYTRDSSFCVGSDGYIKFDESGMNNDEDWQSNHKACPYCKYSLGEYKEPTVKFCPNCGMSLNRRTQDAYALRCVPQVHGASCDAIEYIASIILDEMNAITDNPLIFSQKRGEEYYDKPISGGNFHGQPVALAMDFLGIALAELANISERRLERMVNSNLSNGLPAYLVYEEDAGNEKNAGLHSGFMIVQYAAAALVSENKVLAHPASVDSIPSSNNQEDHVSMGTIAARQAAEILENVRQVIAMELLTAAQAIDLRIQEKDWSKDKSKWVGEGERLTVEDLGKATGELYQKIRERVTKMETDRVISPDIAAVANLVSDLIKEDELLDK